MDELLEDPELDHSISQSLLTGLLVLTAFNDGMEHQITKLSSELGISTTTTLRYLKTWVAIGLLEQDRTTHKYGLARRWQRIPRERAHRGPRSR
jgi:DNA-binding IclR family transcriptional regulator